MVTGVGPADASRTLLELTAELMEASFEELGEGVILATLPRYLERFGAANARYIAKHFVTPDAARGAVSALVPMEFVSRATGTQFTMTEAKATHAVKRLHACEFLDAFDGRPEFPRAMMCMLHKAAYQGSVNGLLPVAAYDVEVDSRILFGDDHCDFRVTARAPKAGSDDGVSDVPRPDDPEELAFAFYTFLLTSFVHYLRQQLPAERVEVLVEDRATRVGAKVHALLEQVVGMPDDAVARGLLVLEAGGRQATVEKDAEGRAIRISACPQALHIATTSRASRAELSQDVCTAACRMCQKVTAAAAGLEDLVAEKLITLDGDECLFRVKEGTQ